MALKINLSYKTISLKIAKRRKSMNRAALHKITYGLYIVTSGQDGKFNGQIANSMFQVTSNPATMAIRINKENYTHGLIKLSRKFVVSILAEACLLYTSDAAD